MCHLLFYSLSIYIKWSLLGISFFFVFLFCSVHWLPTQTLSFPRRRTSVRIDVCSLNLLCSNKDVLYRLCFRRRRRSVTLGKTLWRCSLCVLDCIVDKLLFLSLKACCTGCCGIKTFSTLWFCPLAPHSTTTTTQHVREICKWGLCCYV